MDEAELKQKYNQLIKDKDFDNLDLGLKNPNIFQILKVSKNEIRHSNFLSWLLDPNQSHKISDLFLKRFLREVFSSEIFADVDQIDVESMELKNAKVLREWKNIDLLIILPDLVVCIENKVLSKEHSNQLKKYERIIEENFPKHKHTFVYLTPDGGSPESENTNYEPISYNFIVETLERIISVYRHSLNDLVVGYINDYITIVRRELMKDDKLTELSRKIYQNHQELFDFIYEHKPSLVDTLRKLIIEEITKRGWTVVNRGSSKSLTFLTPRIIDLLYPKDTPHTQLKHNQSFVFEILSYPPTNKLNFKTLITPSTPECKKMQLEKLILEIKGSKPSKGKKWLVNISKNVTLPYEELPSMDEDEIKLMLNKFFNQVNLYVLEVENKLLENRKLILKI